jgi:hypothetical protein
VCQDKEQTVAIINKTLALMLYKDIDPYASGELLETRSQTFKRSSQFSEVKFSLVADAENGS